MMAEVFLNSPTPGVVSPTAALDGNGGQITAATSAGVASEIWC